MRGSVVAIVLTWLVTNDAPLRAQGFAGGIVVDPGSGARLPCVDVALEDTTGHVVARSKTNGEGIFQFDAPERGTYRYRFSIWNHAPIATQAEPLEPTTEQARTYRLSFALEERPTSKARLDTVDTPPGPPREKDRSLMRYPIGLRESGIQGDVLVNYLVDSAGWVYRPSIRVLRSTHHEFSRAVTTFLERAQLTPARSGGQPVCALMLDVPFTFRLGPR